MSKAGIQSNRGDGYQTLIAFDWALSVLSDPDYAWIEVDSVMWSVDDVVIGKSDGSKICCQCKKNQTGFKAWAIADLSDEILKAGSLLATDPSVTVHFYSRNDFGELAALKEFSTNYAEESSYLANLGVGHGKTNGTLKQLLTKCAPSLSTYDFLRRVFFETTPDLDRKETILRERLRQLASNLPAAYNALWTRLDLLGMRINGQGDQNAATESRLTKSDLNDLLTNTGSMLIPAMDIAEVRAAFKSTSRVGRMWRQDIGNRRMPSSLVKELLAAIQGKTRSILVTGLPGSGKTCVMLALQEELEQVAQTRSDLLPIFIQSREFADVLNEQDRQAQGLPSHWVEKAARMAEDAHVVVVIDSLDVLSIAREHGILGYFLAQIDRLLLIPNLTVVTACRDFDRHYDRRIAQRSWDKEFSCVPLDWDEEISPLLTHLGIDTTVTDTATRELIRNPRELALFVELAQRDGSFNVVTSQALAQRYLTTVIQDNSALGNEAMLAIEAMAAEMLKMRSLAVPRQRFTASTQIQRALLSHNVLHETQDGKLTFGHQTLLDVLVISGAIRRGMTLNTFIQSLPPVPFVRPSIRSFVAQLAAGDRRSFRGQLRTVLTNSTAFHIRRLVAECFAEEIPQDEDWSLIRDLRNTHREVFQVVYAHANRLEWHHFWNKHLVPIMKDAHDGEGLSAHVHRVAYWKNSDAAGVIAYWMEVLTLDSVNKEQIAWQIETSLSDLDPRHSMLLAPLVLALLDLPRREHSFLGRVLARCVDAGGVSDAVLWRYIAGEVKDEDVLAYRFDKNLHCQPHEFGDANQTFLVQRMQRSAEFLDMAIAAIERWSEIKRTRFGRADRGYSSEFLNDTSYDNAHTQREHRHVDSEHILLNAIEVAVLQHATIQSDWWKGNRTRLCTSSEGALRYFVILGCTTKPHANLDLISQMLCDKSFLESDLSYELGTLMQAAFVELSPIEQDTVQATVLSIHQKEATEPSQRRWMLQMQAQFVSTIPCHLRSARALAVISECEKTRWPLVRQPYISGRGGVVHAPFSFEVFLAATDNGILRLLAHYTGYERNSFDDFLIGGEQEVGWQLREAASRSPTRFLSLLQEHWGCIADGFRDNILDGVSSYLAYRFGNTQANGMWIPIEEPDASTLAAQIVDELEKHSYHWHHNRAAANALQSCSHVLRSTPAAESLVYLATAFSTLREEQSIFGDRVDLISVGINMAKGHVAEALMIAAIKLHEIKAIQPELLVPTLQKFAADDHPAIRALVLRRLPYLQSLLPDLGWELFDLAMRSNAEGLWPIAEPCLYYAYHRQFEIVAPWLAKLSKEGGDKDLKTWGRISALAALSKKTELEQLLSIMHSRESADAWRGAASVWTHASNFLQHREQCLAGLEAGVSPENACAGAVAERAMRLFQEKALHVSLPATLIQRCFDLLEAEPKSSRRDIYGFDAWLNASASRDPALALGAAEIYLRFVQSSRPYLYDHENHLTQLLSRLFAQAEEQEESDGGAMLTRVVALQDGLLSLGVNGVNDWLKAAERP